MGKELRENAPAARGSEEAGLTQILVHKPMLLSITYCTFALYVLHVVRGIVAWWAAVAVAEGGYHNQTS